MTTIGVIVFFSCIYDIDVKGVYLPNLAQNNQSSIKEGVANSATVGQNDKSIPIQF